MKVKRSVLASLAAVLIAVVGSGLVVYSNANEQRQRECLALSGLYSEKMLLVAEMPNGDDWIQMYGGREPLLAYLHTRDKEVAGDFPFPDRWVRVRDEIRKRSGEIIKYKVERTTYAGDIYDNKDYYLQAKAQVEAMGRSICRQLW